MGLNLNRSLQYTGKHYITNPVDPVNNVEKIDPDAPYILSSGIHIGTIDMSRWKTTLDAYRGIGINRYGIYGVAEEDNTATPKFLLTADYIQDFGWGTAVPGEFRVGDNVREEAGFLVGANWLWYTPVKGLNISGPLLRTVSSDTNIIQSPGFDNITEFILTNGVWDNEHGYQDEEYCIVFAESGNIEVKGNKTIDGAAVIRGSVMFANSDNFPPGTSILVEADIFDINGNLITTSSSTIQPAPYGEWKRHNYVLRLGPHDNEDSFVIRLVVQNLMAGNGHYVVFDNWNAYRVFQAAVDSFDLPEILPENGKSVIYDLKGIRAYWPDEQGNPQLTFELNAANGNAFFAGNMEVRGYVHSGPVYIECNPTDPYNPTTHHEIIGCGINTYAIYGIAPNTINPSYYNIGRAKFVLAARDQGFNRDCDKWYWGDRVLAGELRCGDGIFYDQTQHDLVTVVSPDDIYNRTESQLYLWFYPGDRTLDTDDKRYYPFLTMKGSVHVNGFVHSGPIYDLDLRQKDVPIIGGCGINQYAIYGIKTVGTGTGTDPYKTGESRFLVSNQTIQFQTFDPYWGDQLFEGELRVGLNILYDTATDDLVDVDHNPATDYMWFRPHPEGSALPTKFIVRGSIIAEDGSIIPPEAIDGVDAPEDFLNDHQKWEDVNLTDVADFLSHSQGNSLQDGLVAHDSYFGFYHSSPGGGLYSWRFKVDDTGKTFFGKYSDTADRRFVYWDGFDLRIEGAVFAYKGFFKDMVYIGDETKGIEIYGGDHAVTNNSSMFIEDPITQEAINTPYIRSIDVDNGFSKGGWIILDDGYASYSKLTGIGRNIHITTDSYWEEDSVNNTWTRKYTNSFTGFHATYDGVAGTFNRPACAMYLHDSTYNTDIANFTIGVGCFKTASSKYSILIYNSASTSNFLKDVILDTGQLSAIHLKTEKAVHSVGTHGLYLQNDPTEPIGFFGETPVNQPEIFLRESELNISETDYLMDIINQLLTELGVQNGGSNAPGLGLFKYTWVPA